MAKRHYIPVTADVPGAASEGNCALIRKVIRTALGDMVISMEHVAAQAREYGHAKRRELSYLVVHSVLHLLGYDHLDEGPQKARMRAREEAILGELGIGR